MTLRPHPIPHPGRTVATRRRVAAAILAGLVGLLGHAAAQPVVPLADLYTGVDSRPSSLPLEFTPLGAWTLFVAGDHDHGRELWRTDGTTAGTVLVADLSPGLEDGYPQELTPFGGLVYFTAEDRSYGQELWRTDGTSAGTELVADLWAGPASSSPSGLTVVGDSLYFAALTPGLGRELWRLEAGGSPELVADLVPGSGSSSPSNLLAAGIWLAFRANSPGAGRELWVTDGTAANTDLYDVEPGAASSLPTPLAKASNGNRLFFAATTAANGRELWTLDLLFGFLNQLSIAPGTASASPSDAAELSGALLFRAAGPGGTGLWRSDGTAPGTWELAAVNARDLVSFGSQVYFEADGDLWASNGTIPGTGLLVDPGASIWPLSGGDRFVPHDGHFYFYTSQWVWRSDGTAPGTAQWASCGADGCNLWHMASGADALYLSQWDQFAGYEPWRGASGQLVRLADLYKSAGDATPAYFTAHGDRLFFSATVDDSGREVLSWDGQAPPAVFEELGPGPASSHPAYFHAAADAVYYSAADPSAGMELRRIVPGSTSSDLVLDIQPGTASSSAVPLGTTDAGLFFVAEDADDHYQLWLAAGGGAMQVTDLECATACVRPDDGFAALAGEAFFSADDGMLGSEPWSSDGTGAGIVLDLELGPGSSSPFGFTTHAGHVYFVARTGGSPTLWRTDGTAQNTEPVRSFPTVAYLHSLGPRLVFVADDGASGLELWASDGTAVGTVQLAEVGPGAEDGISPYTAPLDLVVAGGRLFFPAGNATTGIELWVTDGTPAGTQAVGDLQPGPLSSVPRHLTALPDGNVAFAAWDEGHGFELWRSDGTAAGTYRVGDVSPGPASSEPYWPTVYDDWVVFLAFTGPTGAEAWAWRWNPDPDIFSDGFESGDTSAW